MSMRVKVASLSGVRKAGDGIYHATLYDATVPDRDHETIDVQSVRAEAVIPLQADHDRSILKTLGRVSGIHAAGAKLRGRIEFAPPGVSPIADQVRRQVESGITSKVSIGFSGGRREVRREDVPIWRGVEVVELSCVSVPSSVGASVDLRGLKSWLGGHSSGDYLELEDDGNEIALDLADDGGDYLEVADDPMKGAREALVRAIKQATRERYVEICDGPPPPTLALAAAIRSAVRKARGRV